MLTHIVGFSPPGQQTPPPDMCQPELVFLHIPKTAGTSQQNAFKEHYGADNIFWVGEDCVPNIWRYPAAGVGGRFVVGGHKRLSFYPRGLDPIYCAILRDPIERAISLFVYYTRPDLAISERDRNARATLLEKLLTQGIDPDSMLTSIRNCRAFRREISNYQCRYLSRDFATFTGVRRSLRNRDVVIGTLNSYQHFHRELWDLLDWAEEAPVKVNRSRDDYAANYLADDELVAAIRKLTAQDQQLVNWVEGEHQGLWLQLRDASQRRRRLRRLPLDPARRRARQWCWQDAPDLWPPREPGPLSWPLSRVMVAQPSRLFYMPTPGAVDNSIQRTVLALSGVAHQDALLSLGIERVVEQFNTGLLLGDRTQAEVNALVAAEDYYRFAIVYEPVSRLIETYRQRFVEMRELLFQWPRLYELAVAVQATAQPDLRLGISFRQFVQAVATDKFQHWLWMPQIRYLPWAHTYSRFYRPEQLPLLESHLARHTERPIHIEAATTLPAGWGATPQLMTGRYADSLPGELPADPALWQAELVDEALFEVIKGYYAIDFKLYNAISDEDPEVAGP